jgi:hypothetical protein
MVVREPSGDANRNRLNSLRQFRPIECARFLPAARKFYRLHNLITHPKTLLNE